MIYLKLSVLITHAKLTPPKLNKTETKVWEETLEAVDMTFTLIVEVVSRHIRKFNPNTFNTWDFCKTIVCHNKTCINRQRLVRKYSQKRKKIMAFLVRNLRLSRSQMIASLKSIASFP
jgi:hypothetical protein